jgi:hypothetical protein
MARVAPAPVAPAVPLAMPVAVAPVASGSPFETLDQEESSYRRRRRKRKSGGWWKGALVGLCVLGIAGVVMAVTWPHISPVLFPEEKKVAEGDGPPTKGSSTASPTTGPEEPGSGVTPSSRKRPPETSRTPSTRPTPDTGKKPVDPTKPPPPPPPPDPTKEANKFPRRALVISIHNYLYANPVQFGVPGASGHNITTFLETLAQFNGFKIPLNQIAHLSDMAAKGQARPPMKSVIEKTLTGFLDSSRAQDRIMVFFIGHAVETADGVFLVPIEGELDNPATLLPLKWVYDKLAACKARQKVLVLDVARFSPTRGLERPDAGPMGEKL